MTVTELLDGLAAEIRAAVSAIKLPVEYFNEEERQAEETRQPISVFEQYQPANLFETEDYLPFVLVEWLSTLDELRGDLTSTATIGITVGVYAREEDGWKDGLHLLQAVRERLMIQRLIAGKYRLVDGATWEVPSTQPTPFFYAYGELKYDIGRPLEPIPIERTADAELRTVEKAKILKADAFQRVTK